MCKTICMCMIVGSIILTACSSYRPAYNMNEIHNLDPEQIIEFYFDMWNEKQYGRMNTVLSDGMKAKTIDLNSVERIKIVSSEQITAMYELPILLEDLQEIKIYCMEIVVQRKHMPDELCTILYYVGKETNDSPWLIYDSQSVTS